MRIKKGDVIMSNESNGFHSNIEIDSKQFKNKESVFKEFYEAAESKGIYNSVNLDEEIEKQIQNMKLENDKLEKYRNTEEKQSENNKQKSQKNYEMER